MQITQRDIELLKFINMFGICEMRHIQMRFGLRSPRGYQILKRLIIKELVTHQRIFYDRQGIYRLTDKGARFTGLPPLFKIPLATYHHTLAVIDVYLKLIAHYPCSTWVSERQLLQDKYFDGVGKQGHSPDGILVLSTNKHVAIEVELTPKNKKRLENIFQHHAANLKLKEIWYFCTQDVISAMEAMTSKPEFIKTYLLSELLDEIIKPELSE